MSTEISPDNATKAFEIVSLARESIVLLTELIITVIAFLMWIKIIKPFMDQQTDIAKANAAALYSIQSTSTAQAATATAQAAQAEHLKDTSVQLTATARELAVLHGRKTA